MNERTFFDTSMLVYADDRDAGQKSQIAQELLGEAIRSQTAFSPRKCCRSTWW